MKNQNLEKNRQPAENTELTEQKSASDDLNLNGSFDLNDDYDLIDVDRIDVSTALDEFEPEAESEAAPEIAEIEAALEIAESEAAPETDDSTKSIEEKPEANRPGRSIFPYIVIGVMSVSLAALGGVTFLSLDRLASLQSRVSQLQQTVKDISDSASTLSQKAEELKQLQEEETALAQSNADAAIAAAQEAASTPTIVSGEIQGPQLPTTTTAAETTQEEGMLSPSSGSSQTFTNNTDESMDSLLVQIEPLLPQDNGTWSVYVCNLMKGTEGTIGGGKMQAASLIKLFIMGTVYENYESMSQLYGKDNLDGYLRSMITVSDNDAANILVNWLGSGDDASGMAMVNDFCQAHGYTDTSMGRLLLQSSENGDNYTSVEDCGRFLREIYEITSNTAVDASLSHADSMYYLLKLQERNNKLPAQLPDGVHTAHKTGELSDVENDVGIIYDTAKGIDLVVCFMSENLTDTAAAQSSIATNARLIYGYYNE